MPRFETPAALPLPFAVTDPGTGLPPLANLPRETAEAVVAGFLVAGVEEHRFLAGHDPKTLRPVWLTLEWQENLVDLLAVGLEIETADNLVVSADRILALDRPPYRTTAGRLRKLAAEIVSVALGTF